MPFSNKKLNSVRLYSKEVNVSEIGPSLWNSYRYTAHTMHCQWGKKTPKIAPSTRDCVTPPEQNRATARGNMHKNLEKIARMVREIRSWTDRHIHRRAHYNTSPPLPKLLFKSFQHLTNDLF